MIDFVRLLATISNELLSLISGQIFDICIESRCKNTQIHAYACNADIDSSLLISLSVQLTLGANVESLFVSINSDDDHIVTSNFRVHFQKKLLRQISHYYHPNTHMTELICIGGL